jgi:hypothetical protein
LIEKWQITIPLEGIDFKIREGFQLQNAIVKSRLGKWKKKKEEAMITVNVEGDLDTARKKANALIDRIAARLSYSCGEEVRLKEEVYLKQVQPKTRRREKGWGYHERRKTVRTRITIGDRHSAVINFMKQLDDVKQEKQALVDRAVAYYREALAEKNPFQRIATLMSCIQVIVRDEVKEEIVQQHHICDVLCDYVKLERKVCRDYYGRFRSAGAHGQKDILDSSKFQEAAVAAEAIRKITFRLLAEYASRNKQHHPK